MSSWTSGVSSKSKKMTAYLMSDDRWQRSLKEHNHRVATVKSAVDLKSPWGCSRPYVPLPPADGASTSARPTSAGSSAHRASRPTSAASAGRGSAPQPRPPSRDSHSRPTSAAASRGARPLSAASAATSRGCGPAGPAGTHLASQLPLPQQRLCEDMVRMLVSLDKERSKALLEHLYVSAEECRLLQSYSGVYPALLVSNAAGDKAGFDGAV